MLSQQAVWIPKRHLLLHGGRNRLLDLLLIRHHWLLSWQLRHFHNVGEGARDLVLLLLLPRRALHLLPDVVQCFVEPVHASVKLV
jgi:hypothetical protein